MNAKLINGAGVTVSAQQDADFFASVTGDSGTSWGTILSIGQKMKAEATSENSVRIYDGVAIKDGRRIQIPADSYDDFTIPTASQGQTAAYAIGYTVTAGAEETLSQLVVNATNGIPAAASLRSGASSMPVILALVTVEGVNITGVEQRIYAKSLSEIQAETETVGAKVDKIHTIYTRTLTTTVGGTIVATRTGNVVTLHTSFTYAFPIKDRSYTLSTIPVGYRPTRNSFFAATPTSRSGDNMLASDSALMAVIDVNRSDRSWNFNVASSTTSYREYAATLTYITADDYPA